MPMLFRIGHGYDVHALAEGLPLVLGGVGIEHDKGCVAHSDGDVVTRRMRRTAGRRRAGRHRAAFPRHVGRLQGYRLETAAAPRRGAARPKRLLHRQRRLHDPDAATQTAPPHRPDAPDAGRRHGNRCRLRFGQGHHDRAARLRGPRRGRLGLGRSAHLPGITFGTILL